MRFSATNVVEIFRLLEENGVPVWIDGGWGVDALLKRETREHLDLDLIVPVNCLDTAESVLGHVGFLKDDGQTEIPVRLVLRNSEELQIDIHPVTLKPDGSAEHIDTGIDVHTGEDKLYTFVHSAAGLSGVGMIGGRIVRCTTAVEQIRQKVERRYSPWLPHRIRSNGVSADIEDIISLSKDLGIDEDKIAQAAIASEAQPTEITVVNATKQFCLQHVSLLCAEHTKLIAQHAALTAQYTDLTAGHAELTARHTELTAQYPELAVLNAELTAQIDAMRASTFWRLTAPMRWTVSWLRAYGLC